MLISSSTTHGLFTWPEIANSLVPALFGRPKPANHSGPRRRIVGTTAMIQRCSQSSGSHRDPRPQGTAASCAACPFCPQGFQEAQFLHRRYKPLPRGAGRYQNPNRICSVLANETGVICLINRGLQRFFFADVFAANVDVAGVRIHREAAQSSSPRSAYADHGA